MIALQKLKIHSTIIKQWRLITQGISTNSSKKIKELEKLNMGTYQNYLTMSGHKPHLR